MQVKEGPVQLLNCLESTSLLHSGVFLFFLMRVLRAPSFCFVLSP